MKVTVLEEAGYESAIHGLGLNFADLTTNEPITVKPRTVERLAEADGNSGEDKFLRMLQVWVKIEAPLFWWVEFDTYKVGVTSNRSSTMHKLNHTKLTKEMFSYAISDSSMREIQQVIDSDLPIYIKKGVLPQGIIMSGVVNLNYAVVKRIYLQRRNHRLIQWPMFLDQLFSQLKYKDLI